MTANCVCHHAMWAPSFRPQDPWGERPAAGAVRAAGVAGAAEGVAVGMGVGALPFGTHLATRTRSSDGSRTAERRASSDIGSERGCLTALSHL